MTAQTAIRRTGANGPSVRLPGESMKAAKDRLGYQPHGRGKDDRRGNPTDRKNRKLKILGVMPVKRGPKPHVVGDGTHVACVHCGEQLTYATLTVDRIDPDGSYRIDNVVPACWRCNKARGDNAEWRYDPTLHAWGPRTQAVTA